MLWRLLWLLLTRVVQTTTLGHVELVEGMLTANKLAAGARVIFAGTEITRKTWMMTGLQPSIEFERGSVASYLSAPPRPCCGGCGRLELGVYR